MSKDLNMLKAFPRRTAGDRQNALVLREWRLSSRNWNPATSLWMKQLTWIRIVHSGNWCVYIWRATHS